jgi:hypothetical protein
MPRIEIDFERIRAHRGDRRHAFEELCAQLASLEPRPGDSVFHRKGTGADAGVECFVRHADGAECGWQAKYFFQLDASQTGQLDESIEQALYKHPRLTRFIVCIPFNLKDARRGKKETELQRWQAWVKRWKGAARKKGRTLNIELWDETALVERLTRKNPLYEGRVAFWFDQTLLAPRWFKERFEQARAGLGERYTPETNVELPIRQSLLFFCHDPSVFEELEKWSRKLDEALRRATNHLERINQPALEPSLVALRAAGSSLTRSLNLVSTDPGFVLPIESFAAGADAAHKAAYACESAIWNLESAGATASEDVRSASYFLRQLTSALYDFIEDFRSDRWRVVNPRELLVEGDAGVGKSHLFGDAAEHQVARERPALLILGGTLREADPWSQIIEQVGLQGISTETFLGALDAAGQAAGTRTVIFIDAINERHGIALWATRLALFLKTIAPYPHIALALSCRSTYLPYIIGKNAAFEVLPRLEHKGFAGNAAAARYYLDRRGITRMSAPNLVPEFSNPLFLRTCCDYLTKRGDTQFPRGLRGVTSIFAFYSDAVAEAIETRLTLDRGQKIVARALAALAIAFEEGDRGYTSRERAHEIVDAILPSQGSFERSLLAQLESEGERALRTPAS